MKSALKLALLAVLALALPFTGCNDPLNVQDPDIVAPGNLNDKSVLPTIRAGAIGDFALAYTGSGADGTITYAAPLSRLQILNTAIGRFDGSTAAATALATTRVSATTRRTLISLAAVGKARALLDQGQFATAAALVSSTAVPTSFS